MFYKCCSIPKAGLSKHAFYYHLSSQASADPAGSSELHAAISQGVVGLNATLAPEGRASKNGIMGE